MLVKVVGFSFFFFLLVVDAFNRRGAKKRGTSSSTKRAQAHVNCKSQRLVSNADYLTYQISFKQSGD